MWHVNTELNSRGDRQNGGRGKDRVDRGVRHRPVCIPELLTVKVAGVILSFKLWDKLCLVSQKPCPVQGQEERVLLHLMGAPCRHAGSGLCDPPLRLPLTESYTGLWLVLCALS